MSSEEWLQAAANGDLQVLTKLFAENSKDRNFVKSSDQEGNNALALCLLNGRYEVFEWLVYTAKVPTSKINKLGNTMLHVAIEAAKKFENLKEEQIESWKSRMSKRAELVLQEKQAQLQQDQLISVEQAVQEFFKSPDLVIFKYLVEIAHIPLSIKNGDGKSAFDLAEQHEMINLLLYLTEQQSDRVSSKRLFNNLSQNILKLIAEFM